MPFCNRPTKEVRRQSLADVPLKAANGIDDEDGDDEDEDDDENESEVSEVSSLSSELTRHQSRPNRKMRQPKTVNDQMSDSKEDSDAERCVFEILIWVLIYIVYFSRAIKLKMMPKSKKKRARDGRSDKQDESSDDEMPKKLKVSLQGHFIKWVKSKKAHFI